MALAMLYPEPEKGGRGHKGKATETSGFSQQRLREARAVLHHSPELARAVRPDIVLFHFIERNCAARRTRNGL